MPIDFQADAELMTDFSEEVLFRATTGDISEVVTAVSVNRQPVQDEAETPYAGRRPSTMHVALVNTGTQSGRLSNRIVEDESEIEVGYPLGATPRWRKVLRVIRHNEGIVLLEVRA